MENRKPVPGSDWTYHRQDRMTHDVIDLYDGAGDYMGNITNIRGVFDVWDVGGMGIYANAIDARGYDRFEDDEVELFVCKGMLILKEFYE